MMISDYIPLQLLVDVCRQFITGGLLQIIGLIIVVNLISKMIDKSIVAEKNEKKRARKRQTNSIRKSVSEQSRYILSDEGDGFGNTTYSRKDKKESDGFDFEESPSMKEGWKYD